MKARVVSFASGARWMAEGWRLFRVSPGLWLLIALAYWLILLVAVNVRVVGFAIWFLNPALAVGILALSRGCERHGRMDIGLLLEGFRVRPKSQLVLGLVHVAFLALLIGAMALVAGESVSPSSLGGRTPDAAAQSAELASLLVTGSVLYLPVLMVFWFAPALAAWHGMGAAQALFYSFFATLLNWRAFGGYALAAMLILIVIPSVVLSGLLGVTGAKLKGGIPSVVFALFIFIQPTLFASFYASYRDVFGGDDGTEKLTPPTG